MIDVASVRAQNLDEAKEKLSQFGVAILEAVLSSNEVAALKAALDRAIISDEERGLDLKGHAYSPNRKNIMLFDLIPRESIFRSMVEHEVAIELNRYWLGDAFLLSNCSANITRPGGAAMQLHADAEYVPSPWPPYPLALNIVWALDDFSDQNGATRVLLESFQFDRSPRSEGAAKLAAGLQTQALECHAGSIIVMDGKVWHQSGENRTTSDSRSALLTYYIRDFLRPRANFAASIDPAQREELSESLQELLCLRPRIHAKAVKTELSG